MGRKTIIFGNGLGMAIDPEHFSLQNAIRDIWSSPDILNDLDRKLILSCLPNRSSDPPNGEEELDVLQLVVTSCTFLNQVSRRDIHWLTPEGKLFPETAARFVYKVATRLHEYSKGLPLPFVESLCDFLKQTKSHVATLNYDKLIYSSLIDCEVVGRYDQAALIDGITNSGFDANNLERKYSNNFGYYLHLHGSPLFVERDNIIIKLRIPDLSINNSEYGKHIVLTHIKHKPSVISSSYILSTYWDYFSYALNESEEIIFFGYSGLDDHLNRLIHPYAKSRRISVIEWDQAGSQNDREAFWEYKIKMPVNLKRLENITKFCNWVDVI